MNKEIIIRNFLLFILSFCTMNIYAANAATDSLMNELHTTIRNRHIYEQRKEDRLTELRKNLPNVRDDYELFDALGALLDEYRSYNTDSAFAYCRRRVALADRIGDRTLIANAQMNMANVLGSTGMYKEAIEIMDAIPEDSVPDYLKPYYYYIMRTVYSNLADYSIRQEDKERYRRLDIEYQDSLLRHNPPGSLSYVVNYADMLNKRGDYRQAIGVLESYLTENEYTIHDRAICAYTLAYSYEKVGDTEKFKENLLISSIADLQASVREYISLRLLGVFLYKEGDIENAYEFLSISMDDARKCNARLRVLEINDIFPIVNEAYVRTIEEQKSRQKVMIVVISLLVVFLLLAVLWVYRQKNKTVLAHQETKEVNNRLKLLNEELVEFNRKLTEANHSIAENSQIKEEYIAQFMDQCSLYIEKNDAYRKSLNKLLNAGKIDEIRKMLKSTDGMEEELKAFYRNFDSTFLKLFPTFVDDFNELLAPGERIVLKKEGQLNTELRIFALIRLGITDSVKIAQFLRYSVTTIYNYRTKTRNKALGDRGQLEEMVMKIGRPTV